LKKAKAPFDKLRANGKDQWNQRGNPFVLSLSKHRPGISTGC
jgi:hypothetical protein